MEPHSVSVKFSNLLIDPVNLCVLSDFFQPSALRGDPLVDVDARLAHGKGRTLRLFNII
jgi:hypothetical protein